MRYTCGHNKDTVDINFLPGTNKKILVALSGGADSAILLYILAKLNRDLNLNHDLITFTIPRPDGGANYSPKIVEWISNRLQIELASPMIIGDGNLPHKIVVKTAIENLLSSNLYDYLFLAENKIPPVELCLLTPTRAPHNRYKKIIMPFWGVTKDCSLELYFIEGISEL